MRKLIIALLVLMALAASAIAALDMPIGVTEDTVSGTDYEDYFWQSFSSSVPINVTGIQLDSYGSNHGTFDVVLKEQGGNNGTILAHSGYIDATEIGAGWTTIPFITPYVITNGTTYFIGIISDSDGGSDVNLYFDLNESSYADGAVYWSSDDPNSGLYDIQTGSIPYPYDSGDDIVMNITYEAVQSNTTPTQPTILFPNGGELYGIGESVSINYTAETATTQNTYDIQYSDDAGSNWDNISTGYNSFSISHNTTFCDVGDTPYGLAYADGKFYTTDLSCNLYEVNVTTCARTLILTFDSCVYQPSSVATFMQDGDRKWLIPQGQPLYQFNSTGNYEKVFATAGATGFNAISCSDLYCYAEQGYHAGNQVVRRFDLDGTELDSKAVPFRNDITEFGFGAEQTDRGYLFMGYKTAWTHTQFYVWDYANDRVISGNSSDIRATYFGIIPVGNQVYTYGYYSNPSQLFDITELNTLDWDTTGLVASTDYLVRVRSVSNGTPSVWDESDATFSMRPYTAPTAPAITSPNGAEALYDEVNSITFSTSTDAENDTIHYELAYSSNSGADWTELGNISSSPYSWNRSGLPLATTYQVRVRACDDTAMCSGYDTSDADFTIAINTYSYGNSTNLANVSNISAVENFTIEVPTSSVVFNTPVNLSGAQNISQEIIVVAGTIIVDVTNNPSLNTSAALEMDISSVVNTTSPCANFMLYYASGMFTVREEVVSNGTVVATPDNIGGDCIDPTICTDVECVDGQLSFTAQHFDAFGVDYCIPDWSCDLWGDCNPTDSRNCIAAVDNNNCGFEYEGNLSELGTDPCDYCTPSWYCGNLQFECPTDKTKDCLNISDTEGCYAQTNLSSDQFNGSLSYYNQNCGYNATYISGDLKLIVGDIGGEALFNIILNMTVIVTIAIAGFAVLRVNAAIKRVRK